MASSIIWFTFWLVLASWSSALIDQQTFDDMEYCAHLSSDAYAMSTCDDYPEGTQKLQTYTAGAKGYLSVDAQRKWIIVGVLLRVE